MMTILYIVSQKYSTIFRCAGSWHAGLKSSLYSRHLDQLFLGVGRTRNAPIWKHSNSKSSWKFTPAALVLRNRAGQLASAPWPPDSSSLLGRLQLIVWVKLCEMILESLNSAQQLLLRRSSLIHPYLSFILMKKGEIFIRKLGPILLQ